MFRYKKNSKLDNFIFEKLDDDIKTQILEKKAQRGEELLRVSGGIANNPQLGKQVSDMYINSIENKLKILNQVYDKYDN